MTIEAPSIGGIELNFDPKGSRVRQIVRDVIDEPTTLVPILHQAHMAAEQTGATRRVVRAVTQTNKLEEACGVIGESGWTIEAAIPLSEPFEEYILSIMGEIIQKEHLIQVY